MSKARVTITMAANDKKMRRFGFELSVLDGSRVLTATRFQADRGFVFGKGLLLGDGNTETAEAVKAQGVYKTAQFAVKFAHRFGLAVASKVFDILANAELTAKAEAVTQASERLSELHQEIRKHAKRREELNARISSVRLSSVYEALKAEAEAKRDRARAEGKRDFDDIQTEFLTALEEAEIKAANLLQIDIIKALDERDNAMKAQEAAEDEAEDVKKAKMKAAKDLADAERDWFKSHHDSFGKYKSEAEAKARAEEAKARQVAIAEAETAEAIAKAESEAEAKAKKSAKK